MRKLALALLLLLLTSDLHAQATPNFDKGVELIKKKDFKGAIASFTLAMEANERPDGSLFNRALCYYNTSDWENATNDFTKYVQMMPQNAMGYFYRAACQAQMQQLDAAIADLGQALKIDPSLGRAYALRGQVYINMGEEDKACSDFLNGVQLKDPSSQKLSETYCGNIQQLGESLKLDWPDEENWRVADNQSNQNVEVLDLLRNNESFDNWTELGNMTSIKGVRGVPVDTLMNMMYAQALEKAPKAKLTFLERDLSVEHPWIMFTIESPEFNDDPKPESQLWYIVAGKTAVYTSFRAVRQATIPAELRTKWSAFFKTGKVVTLEPVK